MGPFKSSRAARLAPNSTPTIPSEIPTWDAILGLGNTVYKVASPKRETEVPIPKMVSTFTRGVSPGCRSLHTAPWIGMIIQLTGKQGLIKND